MKMVIAHDPHASIEDCREETGKKMEKWGFQGIYVCMLLVMILYWGSMFHPWF